MAAFIEAILQTFGIEPELEDRYSNKGLFCLVSLGCC